MSALPYVSFMEPRAVAKVAQAAFDLWGQTHADACKNNINNNTISFHSITQPPPRAFTIAMNHRTGCQQSHQALG